METNLLTAFLLLLPFLSKAQVVVGGVDISNADSIQVIEVFVDRRSWKNVDAYVDFGQRDNSKVLGLGARADEMKIMDPKTKRKIVFKSTASVINFLEKNDWVHYSNNLALNGGADVGGYYYFRKKSR
jgi:hypothetical protein